MPLPPEVLAARDRMYQAEDALRADVENVGPADPARRRRLVENLQRMIQEFHNSVAALLPRP